MTYPWQENLWSQLLSRYAGGTLPHALLLTGNEGLGKREFALEFAKLLLCRGFHDAEAAARPSEPCGQCQGCTLTRAGTHPDLLIVEPEGDGKAITVDKVRQVSGFLSMTAQLGEHQLVVINPAEKMNKFAANSLLKTLEEPTPDCYLLLISSQPSLLLPTIRSRCQTVAFYKPPRQTTVAWLQSQLSQSDAQELTQLVALANGAPLTALSYGQNKDHEKYMSILTNLHSLARRRGDPVKLAKQWAENDVRGLVGWLILWTVQMIRLKSRPHAPDTTNGTAQPRELQKIAAAVDLRGLFGFYDKLTQSNRLLDSQVNVQLLLEDLLLFWYQLTTQTQQNTQPK